MRIILVTALVLAAMMAATAPSFACPYGYSPCGPRYCCPR